MAETPNIDLATLKAFENTASGHDGVMSDPSGALLIKPCTKAEIDFYETTLAEHPDFGELMPTFVGTRARALDANNTREKKQRLNDHTVRCSLLL